MEWNKPIDGWYEFVVVCTVDITEAVAVVATASVVDKTNN